MTPEERQVIEAALVAESQGGACELSHREAWLMLRGAVRAYRKSLESAPRYYVRETSVRDAHTGYSICGCAMTRDAERIARLLNESDGKP